MGCSAIEFRMNWTETLDANAKRTMSNRVQQDALTNSARDVFSFATKSFANWIFRSTFAAQNAIEWTTHTQSGRVLPEIRIFTPKINRMYWTKQVGFYIGILMSREPHFILNVQEI